MTSVSFLEQPGRWRAVVTFGLLLLVALPIAPLAGAAFGAESSPLSGTFWRTLSTSGEIALASAAIGWVVGVPLGVGSALAGFPGRRFVLAAVSLPVVLPSFLWAIGWSMLAAHDPRVSTFASGLSGCVLVAATTTTALVVLATHAATLELSRSQVEAARLAGGDRAVLRRASHNALVPAAFAAGLGAVLTLSDPGPGQVLGTHTVAAEILTTFAARYDVAVAAKQCLVLTLVVATIALPLAWAGGPRLAHAILARQLAAPSRGRRSLMSVAAVGGAGAFLLLAVVPPLGALVVPLAGAGGEMLPGVSTEAWSRDHRDLVLVGVLGTVGRTAFNTVLYAGGAGALATLIAFTIALAVGRSTRLRTAVLIACVVLVAWPPAAGALGMAHLATSAPPTLDVLVRSRFTVCLVLALHLVPVATALALRGVGALSPSWTYAAAVHGVSLHRYGQRVLWPALRPSMALSMVLVGLLASADAGSVLLLHPPGEASLPLAIFTVMANAPESSVAALCLAYLAGAVTLVALCVGVASRAHRE